jgi:hypothetical protein
VVPREEHSAVYRTKGKQNWKKEIICSTCTKIKLPGFSRIFYDTGTIDKCCGRNLEVSRTKYHCLFVRNEEGKTDLEERKKWQDRNMK